MARRRLSKKRQDTVRREAAARYRRLEAFLIPSIRSAIGQYLDLCRARLQQSAWALVPDLVASGPVAAPHGPDPLGFTETMASDLTAILATAAPDWPGIVAGTIVPKYSMMLGQLPEGVDLAAPAVASAIGPWRSEWLAERTQALVGVPDDIAGQLRTEMTRLAEERGTNIPDARAAAQEMLDKGYPSWEGRAQLIARTECVSAQNQGSLRAWQAMADAGGVSDQATKTWVGGTRPTHSAVSGETVGLKDNFTVGGTAMNGPGDPAGGAGEVCNCLSPDVRVDMPGLRAVTRRWYEGDMVQIRTATGHELAVTPNHPVLRADGRWTPAELVREGDHLVGGTLSGQDVAAPHVDGGPPEVAEVYRAAKLMADPKRVRLRPPDFHGDGPEDGHVEVVPVNGSLLVDVEAASDEQVEEFGLALAYLARAALGVGDRRGRVLVPAAVERDRVVGAAGPVGGGGVGAPPLSRLSGRAVQVRLGTAAKNGAGGAQANGDGASGHAVNAREFEDAGSRRVPRDDLVDRQRYPTVSSPPEDAERDEHAADRGHAHPVPCGEIVEGFAGEVTLDEIVHVGRRQFKGHVYNLDTGRGWYLGNHIITRNCRCALSFELPDSASSSGPSEPDAGGGDEEAAAAPEPSPSLSEDAGDAGGDRPKEEDPFADLGGASDDDLSAWLSEAAVAGDEAAMDRVVAELDRRDQAEAERARRRDADARRKEARDAAKDARFDALVTGGEDPEKAFADVYGVSVERQRVDTAMAQLRANGFAGRNFRDLAKQAYTEEADRMYWLAEDKTKGYFLNKDGIAKGIDPQSLFTGAETRAQKFASRELLDFWRDYGRPTLDDFKAGLLGGQMRATAKATWS